MFENYKISLGNTIEFAMQRQQLTNIKCLIVIDKKDNFIGTLSDGDIRNAILKNKKLGIKIDKIVNKNPCVFQENNYQLDKIKKIIINGDFPYIPIINKNNKLIDIIDSKSNGKVLVQKKIDLPVVIMAGGKGTRLQPSTYILPKPLIPIKGKAIIEHIINEFKNYGIHNFYVSINYKSIMIKAFFSELNSDCKIKYIIEKKPLGTAGSLKSLEKKRRENFIVINCDTIIKTDFNEFIKFHKKNKNDISIISSMNKLEIPYGVCEIDQNQKLKKIDEKPTIDFLANTGCYLINKKIIKLIPKNKYFDFTDLISLAIKKKYKVGVYPINKNEWIDAGTLGYINRINEL